MQRFFFRTVFIVLLACSTAVTAESNQTPCTGVETDTQLESQQLLVQMRDVALITDVKIGAIKAQYSGCSYYLRPDQQVPAAQLVGWDIFCDAVKHQQTPRAERAPTDFASTISLLAQKRRMQETAETAHFIYQILTGNEYRPGHVDPE